MSFSSAFNPPVPASDETLIENKIATDTVTGAWREIVEVQNITQGTVTYYEDGVATTITANEVVDAEVRSIVTGSETISDVTTTATGLSAIPANTYYAYGEVKDGAAIFTRDGTAPDATAGATIGERVNDGGRIELNSLDEINNFQVISLDGITSIDVFFTYKNARGNEI